MGLFSIFHTTELLIAFKNAPLWDIIAPLGFEVVPEVKLMDKGYTSLSGY